MNVPLALQFESTDFFDPNSGVVAIAAVVMLATVGIALLLDKYNRIDLTSLGVLTTAFVSFMVAVIIGYTVINVNSIEGPDEKRINNIEKAYEGVEVIDLTYSKTYGKGERVVTLLADDQTVTATLREDPETFEPTLYPYASEDAVKLEKVTSD